MEPTGSGIAWVRRGGTYSAGRTKAKAERLERKKACSKARKRATLAKLKAAKSA